MVSGEPTSVSRSCLIVFDDSEPILGDGYVFSVVRTRAPLITVGITMRSRYAVFGASGFGREVMPVLTESVRSISRASAPVFIDDTATGSVNGRQIVRYTDWISDFQDKSFVCIAIADGRVRRSLAARCQSDGLKFVEVRTAPRMRSAGRGRAGLTPTVASTVQSD